MVQYILLVRVLTREYDAERVRGARLPGFSVVRLQGIATDKASATEATLSATTRRAVCDLRDA